MCVGACQMRWSQFLYGAADVHSLKHASLFHQLLSPVASYFGYHVVCCLSDYTCCYAGQLPDNMLARFGAEGTCRPFSLIQRAEKRGTSCRGQALSGMRPITGGPLLGCSTDALVRPITPRGHVCGLLPINLCLSTGAKVNVLTIYLPWEQFWKLHSCVVLLLPFLFQTAIQASIKEQASRASDRSFRCHTLCVGVEKGSLRAGLINRCQSPGLECCTRCCLHSRALPIAFPQSHCHSMLLFKHRSPHIGYSTAFFDSQVMYILECKT